MGQAGGVPRISLGRKGQGYIHNPVFFSSQSPSLVPRPFPPPVFDRLQHKNGGEGLGERVMCVTSGRREGGGARRRISRSFL